MPAERAKGQAAKRPIAAAPTLSDQRPWPTVTVRTSPMTMNWVVMARRVPEMVFHPSPGWLAWSTYPSVVLEDWVSMDLFTRQ